MTHDEISIAVDWAAKEGWNPGLNDAECFYNTDPNGYYLGLLDNEPISTISVVKYDNTFSFLGFYIVKEEYRGKGYGLKLWNKAIKYLEGTNIGLDGVVDQQHNYRKSGFKLAYSNIRYEGISFKENISGSKIFAYNNSHFEDLYKFDSLHFPTPRKTFINCWVNNINNKTFLFIDNEKIKGYIVIRKCGTGHKIGPLFAEDKNIAEELYLFAISNIEEKVPVYFDPPEVNEDALTLVEKYNMKKVFETARMYTGSFPELPLKNIFGVTTFELG